MKYYNILEKANHLITKYFDSLAYNMYTKTSLAKILVGHWKEWGLSREIKTNIFIEYMLLRTRLIYHNFKFPHAEYKRFTWGPKSIYSIVFSLKKNIHFSHEIAVYLHNLMDRMPKDIYATVEQHPKKQKYEISQLNIDRAMSKPQRMTKNIASYDRYNIFLLNGQYTNNLGVISGELTSNEMISVTDLERTLIDIAVRPEYAGGVFNVLGIYKKAAKNVSVEKIVTYLENINFLYPYHQCIAY